MKNLMKGMRDLLLLGAFMAFSAGCSPSKSPSSVQGADTYLYATASPQFAPLLLPASALLPTPVSSPIPITSSTLSPGLEDPLIYLTPNPSIELAETQQPNTVANLQTCNYCGLNKNWLRHNDPAAFEACGDKYCCTASCPTGSVTVEGNYYSQCSFADLPQGDAYCRSGCGMTSVKMMLETLGYPTQDVETLWKDLQCDPGDGCLGIEDYLRRNNIRGEEFSVWQREMLEENIDAGTPLLMGVKIKLYVGEGYLCCSGNHFVEVVGYSHDFLIINDPGALNPNLHSSMDPTPGRHLVLTWNTVYSFTQFNGYGGLIPILPPSKP
jgi:hypothetical protein